MKPNLRLFEFYSILCSKTICCLHSTENDSAFHLIEQAPSHWGAAKAVERAYLERPYFPHPSVGVMAQNMPAAAKENCVRSTGNQKIWNKKYAGQMPRRIFRCLEETLSRLVTSWLLRLSKGVAAFGRRNPKRKDILSDVLSFWQVTTI